MTRDVNVFFRVIKEAEAVQEKANANIKNNFWKKVSKVVGTEAS